jgi:ubiquinol-cytochrome c reductase cytochrome b subunit
MSSPAGANKFLPPASTSSGRYSLSHPQPLPAKLVGATSGPVFTGAKLFRDRGCLNCHLIDGYGGRRGPDLTYVGDKLSESDIVIRIVNGGVNVPAFGKSIPPEELAQITAFLQSRKHPMPTGLQAP